MTPASASTGVVPRRVSWWAGLGVVALLTSLYLLATPDATVDLRADRLTALAALDGADPYVPVVDLAETYGSDLWWPWVHPRTPGALVLQTPLTLFSEGALRILAAIGTAAAISAATFIALRIGDLRVRSKLIVAVAAGATSIAVEAVTVGAQASLIALLLAVAWWRLRAGDDPPAGICVGAAVTLKIFPWLLLVLLFPRHKRALVAAVATGLGLNGVGLIFPGVSLPGAIEALSSANVSASLDLNASLTRILVGVVSFEVLSLSLAVLGLIGALAIVSRGWEFDRQWFATLALCLAVSPLLWSQYALVLIPALVWLYLRGGSSRWWAVIPAVGLFIPYPVFTAWVVVPVCVLAVLIGAAVESHDQGKSRQNLVGVDGS